MSKSRLAVILAALAVVAIVGAIVWAAMRDAPAESPAGAAEQVRIEIRAMPIATLRVDGKSVGKTPMILQYAKADREIVIEATVQPHIYDPRTRQSVGVPVTRSRRITLDRDQLIDFTFDPKELRPPRPERDVP